jgi:micrococcal nuclease
MSRLFAAAGFAVLSMATSAAAIGMCGSGQRVTCVVDGDTFWLDGVKYRSDGYDTPEVQAQHACGGDDELALGAQASRRLLELFNTTTITLEPTGGTSYDRVLVVVRSNGEDVADILVREGLAAYYPNGCEFWCGSC